VKLIGYIRVSTQKQGDSGLGVEAQLSAIHRYAESAKGELVHTYREVESGRKDDRPQFDKARAHAQRIKGRLVIGKLDRLSRDVHFISGLLKSGVDFVACDNPHANKLTIHILAAVAEDEADRISQRTKAALAAAKARGVLLGSARPGHWKGREEARRIGAARGSRASKARRDMLAGPLYREVLPIIRAGKDAGDSLQQIADSLNLQGFSTSRGLAWNRMQVRRLVKTHLGQLGAH
jgi:DNA invertase Pin-like site-specific DNA recombinase